MKVCTYICLHNLILNQGDGDILRVFITGRANQGYSKELRCSLLKCSEVHEMKRQGTKFCV